MTNDAFHHAWRIPAESKAKGVKKEELRKLQNGLSNFRLNDAIESGLVKTPRVVIRDDGVPDARTYKSNSTTFMNGLELSMNAVVWCVAMGCIQSPADISSILENTISR
ncbi:MAG: hypothetical protein E3K36_12395 [Candidatus Brocadia sp.]|nr:hypothetical protein [Candidatus Brocadia sp.]